MIEATGGPAAETLTVSEIAAEMERLWLEELRYSPFEAHFLHRVDYQEVLDFVTTSGPGGFSVTGRMAVDISKIQGPITTVTFQSRLVGSGWSEAEIFDGVNHSEKGKLIFSTACHLRQFADPVMGELQRLLTEHGKEEYRRSWGYDFPLAEPRRLEELLTAPDGERQPQNPH